MSTRQNRPGEAILMGFHSVHFYGELCEKSLLDTLILPRGGTYYMS